MFEGRAPRRAGGPGARASSRRREGHQVWEFEGAALHPGRHERRGRPAARDGAGGAVPLRPDAPRLLRRRRPGARHGHQRGVGLGQLPVHDHGLLRAGVLRRQGPRPRPGLRAGLERLALRGVVLAAPGAHRPARHHVPRRPRAGGGRDPPQRRRAASRRSRSPSARTRSGCPRCGTGPTGTRSWRPWSETDTVVSLHVGSSGLDPAPARGGHGRAAARGHALRPAVADRVRRVAVVGVRGAAPRAQDRHERGRHRLGGHAAATGSTTSSTARATARAGTCGPPRCCGATSGSARSTTPRRSTPATPSGSTTSWWRSTTRTATAPGPTPRP